MRLRAALAALMGLVATAGCDSKPKEPVASSAPAAATKPVEPVVLSAALSRPAPARLVAIGDLHGDLARTRRALKLAGAIDDTDAWVGGALVVVQTGDVIDRGDEDRQILDLLDRLRKQAKAAGGELITLLGNHELMNVQNDFRYVTPKSMTAFDDFGSLVAGGGGKPGRSLAFEPKSSYAKRFAEQPVVVKVGDSVFVHGGVLPKYARSLDALNEATHAWLRGEKPEPPMGVVGEDGLVWLRAYSSEPGASDCKNLASTLSQLGAKRMVMGHTVQKAGINPACDEQAWRIDVGISQFYGGPVEALQIVGDAVTVLRETAAP